ncbi:MAG: hypothetical protein ACLUGJ_09675 [Blautia wexlerae]
MKAGRWNHSWNADESGFAFIALICLTVSRSRLVFPLYRYRKSANGHESVNVATVKASNANERSDDAEVYVNTGESLD